jgi:hypothetical protein
MSDSQKVTEARQAWMETTTALMASGTEENRQAELQAWSALQHAVNAYASENSRVDGV